ncbi:hypothetical protein ACVWDD_23430, partial [Escherichia coli]
IGAYQVSGEYAMIKFSALAGAIDEEKVVLESLGSIKRAGADLAHAAYYFCKNGVFTLALFLLFCGIYGGFLIGE